MTGQNRPSIMDAWQHTIALLPQAALDAMDQFFTEMGLDPDGQHAFPCAATKHETAIRFSISGAWTVDQEKDTDELAAALYTKFEMLTGATHTDAAPRPLNQQAAAAAYRAAEKAWTAMNAAGQPTEERMAQAQAGFQEAMDQYMERRIEEDPGILDRGDPEADERIFAERYRERMAQPGAVTDQWAICRHNDGTPDFYIHVVPNPMPAEDRPLAFARFQTKTQTAQWPAADGGTIEFCPCLTCRADAARRMRKDRA